MKKLEFRLLKPEEIEIRVAMCKKNGCQLLLYKDARCDMNILDETVGAENWQNRFYEQKGILFCSLGINTNFDKPEFPERWIWKDDAGSESNTEAEKGNASDARKRAGFSFGLGRELYSSPFIWVPSSLVAIEENEYSGKKNYKVKPSEHFEVFSIGYDENRRIQHLVIVNSKTGNVVFEFGTENQKKSDQEYICSCCGKAIVDTEIKGKKRSAEEVYKKLNGLCLECYKKGKDNK